MSDSTIRLAVFSAQPYDRSSIAAELARHNREKTQAQPTLEAVFQPLPLTTDTVASAQGCDAICVFVQDVVSRRILERLVKEYGVRCVLLRCAGFNNVNVDAARELGVKIIRVPAYSPASIAEFAVTLMMTLNRKVHRAYNRVRENNFGLDGLVGFTLKDSTVGLVGTGKIGICTARILRGFGCRILAYDPFSESEEMVNDLKATYVSLPELLAQSDIVSLHCPLIEPTHSSAGTKHIINKDTLEMMKPGAMLINTSRGGLVDTRAVIHALKTRHLGSVGLDVYEREGPLFFRDMSQEIVEDDVFGRLTSFTNVIVCGHQGFFTREALAEIASVAVENLLWYSSNVMEKPADEMVDDESVIGNLVK